MAQALPGHLVVESFENRPGVSLGLTLHDFCHQRGGCHRDGTTASLEPNVLHLAVLESQVDGHFVAAERIVAARLAVCTGRAAKVPRLPTVVENDFLIEL